MPYTISVSDTATIRALFSSDPVILPNVGSSALHFGFAYATRDNDRGPRIIQTDNSTNGIRGWIPGLIVTEIRLYASGDYVELMFDVNSNTWQVTSRHSS